jgi:LacI family transcriptional regulator
MRITKGDYPKARWQGGAPLVPPTQQRLPGRKRPSMYDVARAAGVSQTTVSLVVNNAPNANIPSVTRDRIWAAIRELGWRPNALARGLSQRRSQTLGLVSDSIATSPHGGKIIQGMQDAAWAEGKMLLLTNTSDNPELERAALEMLLERQVEGLLFAAMYHHPVTPPADLIRVPTVLVDCFVPDRSLPSVVPDEIQGACTATEVLLGKGHRRIAFINSADPVPAASGRLAGYQQALASYDVGFDSTLVPYARSMSFASEGYRCMRELLELPERPTGVFCFNDSVAMGAYDAAKQLGLSIPTDVAIIGFDNHELIAPELNPPLTTMELPHYAMGEWAVKYLLAEPDHAGLQAAEQHVIACRLVERASA